MPKKDPLGHRFDLKPGLLLRDLVDEAILLDLDVGRFIGLNPSGRRIWELLADGCTLGQTLSTLEQEFDVSRQALEAEVAEFLAELEGHGLLRRATTAETPSDVE